MQNGHALVTGATGALGPRVVEALLEAGYAVRTLSLDAPPEDLLPASVDMRIGDINDNTAVLSAMDGVDIVMHLAALLHEVDLSPHRFDHVNVNGTKCVVESACSTGVRRLVFFSTIAVYGSGRRHVLDERSRPQPETVYAESKLAGEKIVLDARGAQGRPFGTVLRSAAVYGSRVKGNYQRLLRLLARGRFVPIGPGLNRRTLVYDRDLAKAAVLAATHDAAAGQVFNVTDGELHTVREIIEAMCVALDRKPPRFALPVKPVRMAARLLERASRVTGATSIRLVVAVDKYMEDVAVDGNSLRRRLGFASRYSLCAGWTETIAELRRAGLIAATGRQKHRLG